MRKELSKKEPKLKDLENSPVYPYSKKDGKACVEKNTKGGVERAFDKEISMGVNHGPPQ